jgi:TPR repeat protein
MLGAAVEARRDAAREKEAWSAGCDQGDSVACSGLGDMLLGSDPAGTLESHAAFERSCGLRNANGCIALARLHEAEGDAAGAAKAYERACELGLCRACHLLAAFLEAGRGVDADPARALKLRRIPCPEVKELR